MPLVISQYRNFFTQSPTYIVHLLVVSIVEFATGLVGSDEWKQCWKDVGKSSIGEIEQ